jgi:FMN-dependent NADH-azoreductase
MKSTLLVLDSSGRSSRSITRRLTRRFAESWQSYHPNHAVVYRDLGQNPPPPVDERWIAAAFSPLESHTAEMSAALQVSESLIDELVAADCVVLGAPIYNFGMPAQLKAYFDQIVRVGRTFAFAPDDAEPYHPLVASKPIIVVTAAGDGSLQPGGALYHLNHLEPHLLTMLGFIGLTDTTFVRVGYDEFQDDRLKRSLSAAEQTIDELAAAMCRKFAENSTPKRELGSRIPSLVAAEE